MIVYNVTVKIETSVAGDWLEWMLDKHIPDVMATGFFIESSINKIQVKGGEQDGPTYAIKYLCKDMETLEKYQNEVAPRLQSEHSDRYRDKFVAFRTLMEEVKRFS